MKFSKINGFVSLFHSFEQWNCAPHSGTFVPTNLITLPRKAAFCKASVSAEDLPP